ncbi:MAG: Rieske (2Fe-2S) protein [Chloroflexota bacterium]|nr:Rieske (2Fe-2S) protein [Chloroflexota bacterium]
MPDERSDAFARYLDALLDGTRPAPDEIVEDEGPMARLAAELAAAGDPRRGDPDPAFVEQLRLRMRDADAGIAAMRDAPPPVSIQRMRVTRRDLLRVGLGAAAGLAAGAAGISLLRPSTRTPLVDPGRDLVSNGEWVPVATLADLPAGAAVRFSTAAFDGFVVNDAGTIRALSSVCTHMGCTLAYRPDWSDLRCPCHGASFDLSGHLANGSGSWTPSRGYAGDAQAYPIDLPPLVRPKVKIEGESVLVWTARA